jgi:hypothetical protein
MSLVHPFVNPIPPGALSLLRNGESCRPKARYVIQIEAFERRTDLFRAEILGIRRPGRSARRAQSLEA